MQFTSCGDANAPDVTVQIDVVALTFEALLPLVESVKVAMSAFSIPAVLENFPGFDYDSETKTHRAVLVYTLAGSTSH